MPIFVASCDRHSQTLNPEPKNKEDQSVQPSTRDMACSVTNFDIFDSTYHHQDVDEDAVEGVGISYRGAGVQGRGQSSTESNGVQQRIDDMVMISMVSRGCLLNTDEGNVASASTNNPPKTPYGLSIEEDAMVAIADQKIHQVASKYSRRLSSIA